MGFHDESVEALRSLATDKTYRESPYFLLACFFLHYKSNLTRVADQLIDIETNTTTSLTVTASLVAVVVA